MNDESNWKAKTLILGALIGALTGVGMALLLVQRAEKQGEKPKLGAGEGFKVGMTLLTMLRQISRD